MPLTYTPLRYPGGKSRLYGFFSSFLKENNLSGCHYMEPYAGGAGLALKLLITEQVWSIHINDLNPFVYSFWYAVVNEPSLLCERILSADVSIEEWRKQKAILQAGGDGYSSLDMAFAAIFLNRTNRSGILDGGVIGGNDQSGKYKIDCRFNKTSLVEKIRKIASYKDRISVTGLDAMELLEGIDCSSNVLVNLDPPYIHQGKNLYMNHYGDKDHYVIRDRLEKARFNWVLTYDNHGLVEFLYEKHNKFKYRIGYSAQGKYSAVEYLVISDGLRMPVESNIELVCEGGVTLSKAEQVEQAVQ